MGSRTAVFRRYRRWLDTGVFDAMLESCAEAVERDTGADMIDGTVVRAHYCTVGLNRGSGRAGARHIAGRVYRQATREV